MSAGSDPPPGAGATGHDPRRGATVAGTAAALATIGVLLLSYVERSILAEPIRGAFQLVHLDPALFRAGIAVLAVLLPLALAAGAWWVRGSPFPIGSGRTGDAIYVSLLGIYAVFVGLPALQPVDPPLTVFRIVQTLAVPLNIAGFCFLLPALLRRTEMDRIFRVFLWVSVAYGVVSLAWVVLGQQTFFGIPLTPQPDDRGGRWAASGFFVQRNTIGSFLLVVIPAAALLVVEDLRAGYRRRAWLSAGGILVLLVWLVLTFSRSSQLGVAVAAGTAALAWGWAGRQMSARLRQLQLVIRSLTLVGLLAAVLVLATAPLWLGRIEPTLAAAIVDDLHGRLRIWLDLWDQTEAHRWIGTGLFGIVSIGPGGVQYGEVYTPHNAFLAQLVYFGVPGLVALVLLLTAMIVEGLRRRWRSLRLEDAIVLGAIGGILAQNQFEHILTYPVLFSNSLSLILLGWWRAGPGIAGDADGGGGMTHPAAGSDPRPEAVSNVTADPGSGTGAAWIGARLPRDSRSRSA